MAEPIRILHVLNQFFAGVGGEEEAGLSARIEEGARGPGRLLSSLDPEVRVVATLVFGDDWAPSRSSAALQRRRPASVPSTSSWRAPPSAPVATAWRARPSARRPRSVSAFPR